MPLRERLVVPKGYAAGPIAVLRSRSQRQSGGNHNVVAKRDERVVKRQGCAPARRPLIAGFARLISRIRTVCPTGRANRGLCLFNGSAFTVNKPDRALYAFLRR